MTNLKNKKTLISQIILAIVLLILLFLVLFPFWLITRTEAGGFIYYATLLFFFTKGYRADKKG